MFTGTFSRGEKSGLFMQAHPGIFFVKVTGRGGKKFPFTKQGIEDAVAAVGDSTDNSITFACAPQEVVYYISGERKTLKVNDSIHKTIGVLHTKKPDFQERARAMMEEIANVPTVFLFYANGVTQWGTSGKFLNVTLTQFDSIAVEARMRHFGSLGHYEKGQEGKPRVFHINWIGKMVVVKNDDGTVRFTFDKRFEDQSDEVIETYGNLLSQCVYHDGIPDEKLLEYYSTPLALDFKMVKYIV